MEGETGAPDSLRGPDVGPLMRRGAYGVTGAHAPDGMPTVEFTTEPRLHGAGGAVRVRRGTDPAVGADLRAEVRWAAGGRAECTSRDSIRFFGPFEPAAEAVVAAAGAVRLVARTPDGALLAGPVTLGAEADFATLAW